MVVRISKKAATMPWWRWVIGIDLFFIVITTVFSYIPDSRVKWHILYNFTLAPEMNLAVWWSGITLLVLGLLTYELFSRRHQGARAAWLIIALIFIGLFMDEVGSLHERLAAGSREIIPYVLAGGIFFAYAIFTLYRQQETRKTAVLLAVGFFLFALVFLQEFIEHIVAWPEWALGLRVGIEEGTELVGFFLCLRGIVQQRQQYLPANSYPILVPNPQELNYLRPAFLGAAVLHLLAAPFVLSLPDIAYRGNPAVLYPVAGFLVLAAAALQQSWALPASSERTPWQWLAITMSLSSVGAVYLSHLALNTVVWLPGTGLMVLAGAALGLVLRPDRRQRHLWLLIGLLSALFTAAPAYHLLVSRAPFEPFRLVGNFYFLAQVLLAAFLVTRIHGELTTGRLLLLAGAAILWLAGFMLNALSVQFIGLGALTLVLAELLLAAPAADAALSPAMGQGD